MLSAGKIAYIDPASGGSSGIYLEGLFQRLGLSEQVKAKAILVPGVMPLKELPQAKPIWPSTK